MAGSIVPTSTCLQINLGTTATISHRAGHRSSRLAEGQPMSVDIRKPLKKILPHLTKAAEDNLNEADTRQRISKVLEDALGYDPLTEVTREAQVKEKYVDIAVKIDGVIKFLIEVKSAATTLRDRHIDQAQHYAAEGNIPWVVLTNGIVWNLYHLSFDEGIEYTRAFSVDLSSDPFDGACERLGLLHRQSIKKGQLEEYWEQQVALSAESIGRALFTDEILKRIRREIRRHEGILIDEEDLGKALHDLLSVESRERIGPLKIRRTRKIRTRTRTTRQPGTHPVAPEVQAAAPSESASAHPSSDTPTDKTGHRG